MWLTALLLSGCGDERVPCAERSPDACGGGCGVIEGRAVIDGCVDAEWVALGCFDADVGCDDLTTEAADPDGQLWWFPSLCVPAGYTGAGASSPPDC